MAHGAKSKTCIFIDNYPSHKCQPLGRMNIEKRGLDQRLNKKRGLVRTDSHLHVLIEPKVYTLICWSFLLSTNYYIL